MDLIFHLYRLMPILLHHTHEQSNDQRHVNSDKIDGVPKDGEKKLSLFGCLPKATHARHITYFLSRFRLSISFSRCVVKSLIVSEAVVPLIVSSRKISPRQSSNLFHNRCVVSRGRLRKSITHLPMLVFFVHTTTSSSWSSSNKWRSNCSNHFARGVVLLLYFSLPSLWWRGRKMWEKMSNKLITEVNS